MGQGPQKITGQWADGPFQLLETPRKRLGIKDPKKEHGAISAATDMTLLHNCLIRILNCIYLQARQVREPKDISDFAIFMHAWCVTIHEHHGNEEKIFFPLLEEYIGVKNYMEKNVQQHHAFNPGLAKFEAYVKAVMEKTEPYDGAKVLALIDDFGPVLTTHLNDEIAEFEALESMGDKINWKSWNKNVADVAVKTADMDYEIPVVLTNLDLTFEKGVHESVWPPFPRVAAFIFRWIYVPRHKGAWRFSCCDAHGIPKNLEFLK